VSVDLAWHAYGDGPPIVILHGLFGAGRNWRTIAERLASHWRVYTVDLRNHGSSPAAPAMTFAAMADDLAAFFLAHQLYSAALIGHSLGGKTAMLFALEHPGLVDDLIVVDIAPVAYAHTYLPYIEAMQAIDLKAVRRRRDAEAMLAPIVEEPAMRAFLVQNLRHTADGGFAWRINLDAIGGGMADLTGWPDVNDREYPNRALFVSGEHSDYIGRAQQAAIFALFPQAEFAVIADAGHRVHSDQPQAFTDRVIRFLDSGTA
jgi:pimeloyl-ACP methyl ester carboxylesterase